MSTTVDQRVVEMRFDNQNFEKNVQGTISTLDKLKQSLNLTGASKSLENIDTQAKRMDFTGVSNAVESVRMKFSALEIMGVTALANITNSAVNAGKRIVSALTIDPIKTGLSEYETQINAIQTIMANTESKGTTLKDVNKALDELNEYADKTIYNFTEMTRNIGTFTAAGVDLDTSVSAIKGIANLAAVSGSSSQQASTAMYQLSQALANGKVSLMDWNSVVNAGMGGEVFQNALKRTAENMGTDVDKLIKKYGSFRESLTEGEWLTTEVLTKTLEQFTMAAEEGSKQWKKYKKALIKEGYSEKEAVAILKMANTATDAATKVKTATQLWDTLKETAQSGWSQTWEIVMGDFEEAKSLFSEIYNTLSPLIEASAASRNEMLQGWKDLGGRAAIVDSLRNAFEGVMSIVTPIKEAFREVFPPMTAKQLVAFSEGLKNLTAKLKLSESTSNKLKSTFKGIFSVIDIGVTFVKELVGGIVRLISNFTGVTGGVLGATSALGDWLSNLRDSVKTSDVFGKAIDKIVNFLQKGIDKLKEFSKYVKEKWDMYGFQIFLGILKAIWDFISKIGSKVAEVGKSIGEALTNALRTGDVSAGLDVLNGGLFAAILVGIKNFVGNLSGAFDDAKGLLENVKDILGGVKGVLEAWQQDLKAGVLLKIASAIGILAASILVISLIDPEKLNTSLGAITVLFADLMGSLALFGKVNTNLGGTAKAIGLMMGMSISVLILASALKKIASIDTDQLYSSLIGVMGLTTIVVLAAKALSKGKGTVMKGAGQMVVMAIAINILASACKTLSKLSVEELQKGLTGVTILMTELTVVAAVLSKVGGKMVKGTSGLILMAVALKILTGVAKDFGGMSWESLGKAGAAIGGILVMASIFSALSRFSQGLVKSTVSLTIMAGALSIMADVAREFGGMDWTTLGKAAASMGGILVMASIFSALSRYSQGLIKSTVGLTIMAGALSIMADVAKEFGKMNLKALGKAGIAMGGVLAMAIVFSALASMTPGMLSSSAALLVMAVALNVLTPALTTLGNMSLPQLGMALLTLAGAFAVIGVAGLLLGPLVPAILGLAGAFALIGVGIAGIGAGLMLISAGLTALSVAGTAGATAITASLAIIITGIANLIPTVIQKIAEGIILFCQVIIQASPTIGAAITSLLLTIVNVINQCAPSIITCAINLITQFLTALAGRMPEIVQAGFDIFISLLEGIRDNIGDIATTAVDIVVEFLEAVAEKLPDIVQAGFDIVISLIEGLAKGIEENAGEVRDAMEELAEAMINAILEFLGIHSPSRVFAGVGTNVIEGLVKGLGDSASNAVSAIKDVGGKLVNGIASKASSFVSKGKELAMKLKDGISNKASALASGCKEVVTGAVEGLSDKLESFKSMGSDLMAGLKGGIEGAANNVVKAAKGVVNNAIDAAKKLLGIKSPSRVFYGIGSFTVEGFTNALSDGGRDVFKAGENMANSARKGISGSISRITDLLNNDMSSQPVIRPVLDLSDIQSGAGTINGMFDNVGIGANLSAISNGMNARNQNGTTSDVVSAINRLHKDLDNAKGTTNNYNINGITYDDGSNITEAVGALIHAAKMERRV